MKKLFYTIAFCWSTTLQAQEFSFKMFFKDAVGNKDSLTFGYDANATDSIDVQWSERNVIDQPRRSIFDVRITNSQFQNQYVIPRTIPTYHLKKQIGEKGCEKYFVNEIEILAKNWPVTAYWDSTVFNNTICNSGSLFTGCHPLLWWDVGTPSGLYKILLNSKSQVTFDSNFNGNSHFSNVTRGDTISYFWQAFKRSESITLDLDNSHSKHAQLDVFPNPTSNRAALQLPEEFGMVKSVKILSNSGEIVFSSVKEYTNFDLSTYAKGLYLISVENEKGERLSTRVVKE